MPFYLPASRVKALKTFITDIRDKTENNLRTGRPTIVKSRPPTSNTWTQMTTTSFHNTQNGKDKNTACNTATNTACIVSISSDNCGIFMLSGSNCPHHYLNESSPTSSPLPNCMYSHYIVKKEQFKLMS